MIFLIVVGLVIVPVISMNPINSVNAQSQSATSQQTSQPHSQNNSKAQVGQVFTFNEKSKPANDPEKCAALASEVKGKAIPDYNLCDVVVYRQAPAIVRHDGLVLNNFSGIGHYIEMVLASVLNNTAMYAGNSSNSNDNATNLKAGFGEFALIDSEVIPVREIMQKDNWTETALHHHMLGETPKILFLHWSVTGDANDLINQAKEMMMQTATYQNLSENSKTPTSTGP
ncbi:DUF1259 domain-containing protein [Candidatus Nitrosocosmicus sp. T]